MASDRMKSSGTIEFNGGRLRDIRHSYVIQEDILMGTTNFEIFCNCSCVDCAGDIAVFRCIAIAGINQERKT